MKEHNTDYLSTESLKWQPRLGIHAANIAPEYGVAETRALIRILKESNQEKLLDDFLKLSYDSKKWEKWMLKDTNATDTDRSYCLTLCFATKECIDIKNQAKAKVDNLDDLLKNAVMKSIERYMTAFNSKAKNA